MALQPYVHVETLEEYSERFKDFADLERTEDGILLCRLHWKRRDPGVELPGPERVRRALDRHRA